MLATKNPNSLELVENVTAPLGSYVKTERFPNMALGLILAVSLSRPPQVGQRIRDRHGQSRMRNVGPTPLRIAGQLRHSRPPSTRIR